MQSQKNTVPTDNSFNNKRPVKKYLNSTRWINTYIQTKKMNFLPTSKSFSTKIVRKKQTVTKDYPRCGIRNGDFFCLDLKFLLCYTKNRRSNRSATYDSDLGLYCLKTRYYDSETGRFISLDGAGALSSLVNIPGSIKNKIGQNFVNDIFSGPISWITDLIGERI